jgi:hypothetical protein
MELRPTYTYLSQPEPETGMHNVGALVDTGFVDDDRNLNFGGRNHLDVNPGFSQHLEHFGGDT